jgi:glycosyltransferase involved in cell wall biosynthesis
MGKTKERIGMFGHTVTGRRGTTILGEHINEMPSDSPLVSVIMPNLNKVRHVKTAIESILHQSYENFELLFVDGGSSDDSREMAEEYAQRDERIIVLLESRRGVSFARNTGLRESHGDLVAFLDSDDICHERRLSEQVNLLVEKPDLAGCHTNGWVINESGEATGENYHPNIASLPANALVGDIFRPILRRNFILGGSMMLRRTFVTTDSFDVNLRFGEDWDLWIRLAYHHRLAYIPKLLYGYRLYPGNFTWKLMWTYHPLIYEKCLRTLDLAEEDRRFVARKLLSLYKYKRRYRKLVRLLFADASARKLALEYLRRHQ